MTATTFHRVRSDHPEDDAVGHVFAPGELVPNLDLDEEFNQRKVDEGIFVEVDSDEVQPGEGGTALNATDAAQRLANENDIDLSTLSGSGKDGRIIDEDVQNAIEAKERSEAEAEAGGGEDEEGED